MSIIIIQRYMLYLNALSQAPIVAPNHDSPTLTLTLTLVGAIVGSGARMSSGDIWLALRAGADLENRVGYEGWS